ncbi:MAG: sensor domain-containing diguanylate cyclase [Bacillota bacterium]
MRAGNIFSVFYLWSVTIGGVVLLSWLFPVVDLDFSAELAVLILLVMAGEWLVISFPHGQLSAGWVVTFAAFLVYGPAAAAWVTALGILFGQGIANRGNPARTTLFNAAQSVPAVYGAYLAYLFCGGTPHPGEMLTLTNVLPLLAFSAAYFVLNNLLVTLYLLPRRGLSLSGWCTAVRWDASTYLLLIPLGSLVAALYRSAGFTGAFSALLLGLIVQFFVRRFVMVEENNRELRLLYTTAQGLGACPGLDELLKLILREVKRLVPYDTAAVYLWSEERHLFVPVALEGAGADAGGLHDIVWERDEGIAGWAAQNRKPRLVTDLRREPEWQRMTGLSPVTRSLILLPLVFGNEMLGVFVIGDKRPGVYDEKSLGLLSVVGGQVAAAADNWRLHRRLQKVAGRDYLTGLPNREQFVGRLEAELFRYERRDRPLAVILLEIDGLYDLNRRFGYAAGDTVLVQVARAVEEWLPADGTAARYGGDEFALLLPDTGEIRAAQKAERLQRMLEQISFGVQDRKERVRLPVRTGFSTAPLDGVTSDALLAGAEERLRLPAGREVSEFCSAGGHATNV